MPVTISVKADVRQFAKGLDAIGKKQLAFAASQAVNKVALRVQKDERTNMQMVLDFPTPFTLSSVGVSKASRAKPMAMIYVKPVAAAYLKPYEFGGLNKLNSQSLLLPVGQKVNKYGNLPRYTTKRLLAKPNVFIGEVTINRETIHGIWQRPKREMRANTKLRNGKRKLGKYGSVGDTQGRINGKRMGGLKLLIRFDPAHQVTQHLNYRKLAAQVVAANFRKELTLAMAAARKTARP